MKKNQKYTQEEMYMAIEPWKESGVSQKRYCQQNGIAYNTFKYWFKKYQKWNTMETSTNPNPFLPVKVTAENYQPQYCSNDLTITYPNGIEVRCPSDINTIQLKNLLTII